MISGRDLSSALAGTVTMARADERWRDRLDMSTDAVFRSFWAIPLALPPHLLAAEGARRISVEAGQYSLASVSPMAYAVSETAGFLIAWGLQLALLVSLARRRGAGWKISPLIIGFNWAIFLTRLGFGLFLGLSLMTGMGVVAPLTALFVFAFSIWIKWGVIRRTLDTSVMGTIGVLGLLYLVVIAISILLGSLFVAMGVLPTLQPAGS
ncbi:MAG: hypothetical protein AAF225_07725 [Pseudomonadota bacterium]